MGAILKMWIPILIICFLTTSCATTVTVRPARGVVVTKLNHPRVVVHNNVRYYKSRGVWYIKKNKSYRTVTVPVGVRVTTLPRGYKVVKIRGVKYFAHNGVYYKRSGRKYIVVNV
ncbi:DUF6515 family protein [Aquimarina sp. AU474]|uniref:DUF6515 family protein n=1 Tax=Aquimarina sp. AU474 TaxID=2108529 RepID=UPI0013568D7D|nr:DUF6515 family protein [Aquimarina sp. AU474]